MNRIRIALLAAVSLTALVLAGCGGSGATTQAAQDRLRIELTSPTVRGAVTEGETTVTGVVSSPSARVTVNDATVTVGSDGAFTQTVPLAYGSNRIVVRASAEGMTEASRTVTITRSLTLRVDGPSDGTTVDQNRVAITGNVSDPDAVVTILGIPVAVGTDGAFAHTLSLHYPKTIIAVSASVGAGTPISQTITVNYPAAQ